MLTWTESGTFELLAVQCDAVLLVPLYDCSINVFIIFMKQNTSIKVARKGHSTNMGRSDMMHPSPHKKRQQKLVFSRVFAGYSEKMFSITSTQIRNPGVNKRRHIKTCLHSLRWPFRQMPQLLLQLRNESCDIAKSPDISD